MKMATMATPTVTAPRMMNSHRQPARPCTPPRVENVAAEIRPARAVAIIFAAMGQRGSQAKGE